MNRTSRHFRRHALATAVVLAVAGTTSLAQLSTSTIKGQVASAQAGTAVVAVNLANGSTYRTTTLADGSYVLAGLAPGSYEIRVGGQKSQAITVQVGETASVDLTLGGQTVTIIGSVGRKDVKNSESSVTVSRRQIETLPQVTRNFLAFADLAPGVLFSSDPTTGYTRIQSGAQSSDRVNVYIDGMSQKNDLTRGGISGQNESRGNPFPQSAIAEYKVITQGYKAEFGTVSSTAITAVTRSGTNTTQGEVFADYAGGSQIAYSPFEKKAEANGVKRPDATQWQYGASIGGAIKQDQLHYFLAYEGKRNTIPTPQNSLITGSDSLAGVAVTPWLKSNVLDKQWNADRSFQEDLLFAKLTAGLTDQDRLELSFKYRDEKDTGWLTSVDHPDWGFSKPSNAIDRANKETRVNTKWEHSADRWLNEVNVEALQTKYVPEASDMSPFIEYKRQNWSGVMMSGRMEDRSRNNSTALTLKDDFTYTGKSGHVIKSGVSLSNSKYEVGGSRFAVPHYFVFIGDDGLPKTIADTNPWMINPGQPCNVLTGIEQHPTWEPFSCTGTPAVYNTYRNNKVGLYLQDDIALTRNIEINAGLRWDYESNAFNNDYVTPQWVKDKFAAADTRNGAAPNQTYAQSLAKGGVNIGNYISTGKERKAYTGAIQPRLGLSWDLQGDKSSVVTVQAGRAYDRTPAMKARDELINNSYASATGAAYEIWLLNNNLKMPYADQFGVTLRQRVGDWNTEVGLQQVRGHNEFAWVSGGRNADGSLSGNPWEPDSAAPGGVTGRLLLGESIIETKTNKLFLSADKPYSKSAGWGASASLTINRAYTNAALLGAESSFGNQFSFVLSPTLVKSVDVEPYRFVGTYTRDLPWGIVASVKGTYGGKAQFMLNSCAVNPPAGCTHTATDANHFEQVDLMLAKEVQVAGTRLTLRADVLNVLNKVNYGKYNDWGGWGSADPNAGQPIALRGPMRTVKLGLTYKF